MPENPLAMNSTALAAWMLAQLNNAGDNAGSDYNDGENINGWFGWSVTDIDSVADQATITITFENEDGGKASAEWRLMPITDGTHG